MCVEIKWTYCGHQRRLIIGPAPGPANAHGPQLVDARLFFQDDERFPGSANADIATLREAARAVADRFGDAAGDGGNSLVRVQCAEGRSRSPRVAGAFLKLFVPMTTVQVMNLLREGYAKHRIDGCQQALNEDRVEEWIREL